MAAPQGWKRQRSVAWFKIVPLIRSGREAAKATDFARFADARLAQANAPSDVYNLVETIEYPTRDYVVDYVADTGDGYNATWAIARSVEGVLHSEQRHRADLLVLGGDEVYPVAKVEDYDNRLKLPYLEAAARAGVQGFVVALPGNHDWYDGLAAFSRNFCQSYLRNLPDAPRAPGTLMVPSNDEKHPAGGVGEPILGRRLFQSRSYFALKLPHGWWLWGIDAQLDSYVDVAQLEYFERARDLMGDDEQVLLCFPRPAWTDEPALDTGHFTSNREIMTWFVDRFFGSDSRVHGRGLPQVRALISGDKHHFVRYDVVSPVPSTAGARLSTEPPLNPTDTGGVCPEHLITCGGGGAFLSSTHHAAEALDIPWVPRSDARTRYSRVQTYPELENSRNLRWGFVRIAFLNGLALPVLVALIGLTTLTFLPRAVEHPRHWTSGAVVALSVWLALVGAVLVSLSLFFRPRHVRKIVGSLPGAVHLLCHLVVSTTIFTLLHDLEPVWASRLLLASGLTVGSWLVFSAYFFVCDCFGPGYHWHDNEFFSAMRYDSYKSHLRLTISAPTGNDVAGRVRVVAHGIRQPPDNVKNHPQHLEDPIITTVADFVIHPSFRDVGAPADHGRP